MPMELNDFSHASTTGAPLIKLTHVSHFGLRENEIIAFLKKGVNPSLLPCVTSKTVGQTELPSLVSGQQNQGGRQFIIQYQKLKSLKQVNIFANFVLITSVTILVPSCISSRPFFG